jgi:hypothetical protein
MQQLGAFIGTFVVLAITPLGGLPTRTWLFLIIGALLLWPVLLLLWSLIRWTRDLLLRNGDATEISVIPSTDDYILLNQWDAAWIRGISHDNPLQSKSSTLLIRLGRNNARGTVRYSQVGGLEANTLALPQSACDALGIPLPQKPVNLSLSVRVSRRFALEALWNSADPSTRASFRTAIWLAIITTTISFFVPIIQAFIIPH